jgi:hypothetical protein
MTLIQLHLPSPIVTLAGSKLLLYLPAMILVAKSAKNLHFPLVLEESKVTMRLSSSYLPKSNSHFVVVIAHSSIKKLGVL